MGFIKHELRLPKFVTSGEARWCFRLTVCALIVVAAASLAYFRSQRAQAKSNSATLHGAAAIDQLKRDGQYDSLQSAMNAARLSVNHVAQSPFGRAAWHAPNRAAGYDAYVTEAGVSLVVGQDGILSHREPLSLRLHSLGHGDALQAVGEGRVSGDKQSITIERDNIREWFVNGANGLEHGFTLAQRPQSSISNLKSPMPLRLALQTSDGWRAESHDDGQSVGLRNADGQTVEYGKLAVSDARGANIPARLTVANEQVVIEVEDREAAYPLTIDPLFTLEQKLWAADGAADDQFGWAVALDGNTAAISAWRDTVTNAVQGSVYVFVRSGTTWAQQARLVANDATDGAALGWSVALEGNTLVAGALGDDGERGAAYVFVRNGTVWTQQKKLVANDGVAGDRFGQAVAISGETVAVSAYFADGQRGSAYVFTRSGTNWTQQQKVMANDRAAGDSFGTAVALDGEVLAVGAPFDTDIAANQGSVYVFRRNGTVWTQQPKLTVDFDQANEKFGSAVALSGNTLAVGATGANLDSNNTNRGAVYVFTSNGTAWALQKRLFAADGAFNESFGQRLALSGDTLIAGRAGNRRAVLVFARTGLNWTEQTSLSDSTQTDSAFGSGVALSGDTVLVGAHRGIMDGVRQGTAQAFVLRERFAEQPPKLTAFDGATEDEFGHSIAVSGDTLAVGAWTDDIGTKADQGSVYVFRRNGTARNAGWTFQQKLIAPDGATGDAFGNSVALSGNTLAVGAYAAADRGAVYVFIRNGATWEQQKKLFTTAGDGSNGEEFGLSVALDGDTLAVGVPRQQNDRGAAYVFTRTGTNWTQQGPKLLANDGASGDFFGGAIALSGDTVVAGARSAKIGTNSRQGAAYVFTRNGTTWAQQQKLTASDGALGEEFGRSVAVSGDTAAVGAPRQNSNRGAAYVFNRSGTVWTQQPRLTANDGVEFDFFGIGMALSGDVLVVGADGFNFQQGAAYVFTRAGAWVQQQQLLGASDSNFGFAVALSGDTIAVGAYDDDNGTNAEQGSAYVYAAPRCPIFTVNPASLPNGVEGAPYNQPLTVSGGGLVEHPFSLSSGALPPGLTLDVFPGKLHGIPTTAGTYRFTITATSVDSLCPGSRAYTLTITPPCPILAVSPASVPGGTVGAAYSQTLTAGGGTAPYSFAVASGALPPGLNLSANGVLSGTPTTVNAFTFVVGARDANGCQGLQTYTINVACPTVTLNPATLPNGATGTAYSQTLTASSSGGGAGAYTFSVTAGALPQGLSLSASGVLSGTPTTIGQSTFSVTAGANGCTGTRQYELTVGCATLTITPSGLPIADFGQSYQQTLTASGGTAPYTFSLLQGALPAGITLSTGGSLSGTPSGQGSSFQVRVTDANGCTGSNSYTLNVIRPLTVTSLNPSLRQSDPAALLNLAQVNDPAQLTATLILRINSGTSATVNGVTVNGLAINAAGVLTANVAASCTATNATFSLLLTDNTGTTVTTQLTIVVTANPATTLTYANQSVLAGGALQINPATGPSDNGSVASIEVLSVGAFTGTLSVNSTTGVVNVSNAQPGGSHTITIRATDNCGATRDASFTLSVGCPAITIAPANLPNATKGVGYQQTLTANGGAAPYTFAVTAGALPQGLSLGADGVLTGTPTQSGSFNFTVTATDANGCAKAQGYGLSVNAPPSVTALNVTIRQSDPAASFAIANADDADQAPQTLTVAVNGGGSATVNGVTVNGVTINAAGAVSANVVASCTATNAGFTLTVADNAGATANTTINITVTANPAPTLSYANQSVTAGGALTITPTTGPSDNGNVASITVLNAGAFTGTINVNNTTGVINVSNAQPAGSHTITIRATDNCGATSDASFTLGVGCPAITIAPATLPVGTVGAAYNQTLTASGGAAPYSFSVSAGALPAGLNLSAAGQLTGTPTVSGPASFTVTASDANGCAGISQLTLTVNVNCPTITVNPSNATLPAGQAGTQYNQTFTQTGGAGTTTFAVTTGTLPNGLSLAIGGALTGTPTAFGDFNFTVTATDANGCNGSRAYLLHINAPCATITVNPTALPNGTVSAAYNQTAMATGGAAPYTFTVSAGSLPTGLTLASGGAITGAPNAAGAFNFTVQATDANGCFGTRAYSVIINSVANNGLQFYPLAHPVRLLETRAGQSGCFTPGAPIAAGTSRTQPARGLCDGLTIPANAQAVTGNITTVNSGGGFLTLYPSNAAQPLVANTNYGPNEIVNNVFTVGLGNDGAFKIFALNATDVVVDVTGYYAPPPTSGAGGLYFHPLPKPIRLLETRAGQMGCFTPGTPLTGGAATLQLGQTSCGGVTIPAEAQALVGNATTVGPQSGGYLTLYPANAAQPLVASSNFQAGQVMNAPFTVGLSPSGHFNIFTTTTTDLVVDVLGYYSAQLNDVNGAGLLLHSLPSPTRLLDTRAGQTGCFTPGAAISGGSTSTQIATGVCTAIPATAKAIVGNATVVNAQSGYLTFWPSNASQPLVATSNYLTGQVFNRHFTVGLGADGAFKMFASATTDLVIDLTGYFAP